MASSPERVVKFPFPLLLLPTQHLVMDKVKEQLTKLPPLPILLKYISMGSGLTLSILGVWLMFAGFITFGITSVLVGFYLMCVLVFF